MSQSRLKVVMGQPSLKVEMCCLKLKIVIGHPEPKVEPSRIEGRNGLTHAKSCDEMTWDKGRDKSIGSYIKTCWLGP